MERTERTGGCRWNQRVLRVERLDWHQRILGMEWMVWCIGPLRS